MALAILFGTFAALLLIGTPVAFCLGAASLATVLCLDIPPPIVVQRLNSGVSVFALMAIPFFIYAGDLMVRGGIAARLVALAGALVGRLRGGLGQVNIAASTLFGGISGSAVADASAIGGLMIPQMTARGYDVDYAVNVTVTSAVISLMLPPSHNMIIYAIAAGGRISIADLFTAGIVPGVLLALGAAAWWVARRRGYGTEAFPGWRILGVIAALAAPGLLLVAIIFGGVRSGVSTATGSAGIAILYALLVTLVLYRSMGGGTSSRRPSARCARRRWRSSRSGPWRPLDGSWPTCACPRAPSRLCSLSRTTPSSSCYSSTSCSSSLAPSWTCRPSS